jgi:hypothetical protein
MSDAEGRDLPTRDQLIVELRQLAVCRWGLRLLGAGLMLVLGSLVLQLVGSVGDRPRAPTDQQLPAISAPVFLLAASGLVVELVGAVLFGCVGRSDRWRVAARWLAITLAFDAAMLTIVFLGTRPATTWPGAPWQTILASTLGGLCTWFEIWWVAVLVAEFSLASRAGRIVAQTEQLGYLILGGAAMSVVSGTSVLLDPQLATDPDGLFAAVVLSELALNVVGQVWVLRLVFLSATLARFLLSQCRDAVANTKAESQDRT